MGLYAVRPAAKIPGLQPAACTSATLYLQVVASVQVVGRLHNSQGLAPLQSHVLLGPRQLPDQHDHVFPT